MTVRIISLVWFVLLLCWTGCTPQTYPDTPSPGIKRYPDAKQTQSRFSRRLALTTLNFSIDDCRSNLRAVHRAMDDLGARTQREHWESTKKRSSELDITYSQLCQRWADMGGESVDGDENRLHVEARLDELGQMLQRTRSRIVDCDKNYAQARTQYEAKKKRFFKAFQADLQNRHVAEGRFYTGGDMTLGLSAIDILPQHILVTIEAYAAMGKKHSSQPHETLPMGRPRGLSSLIDLENQIRLVDEQGVELGSPVEIEYDRLHTVDGLIVTLAYERRLDASNTPGKLLIEPFIFKNKEPISLTIPFEPNEHHIDRGFETADLLSSSPFDDAHQVNGQMKMIRCQRVGMHLKVPVTLDIHGVKIRTSMILDTGASMTVLPKSLYNRGIAKPLDSLARIRMKTANGFITCPVDRLTISTSAYTKTISVALANDSTSLLGANYFSDRRITMDLNNECIYIHPEH